MSQSEGSGGMITVAKTHDPADFATMRNKSRSSAQIADQRQVLVLQQEIAIEKQLCLRKESGSPYLQFKLPLIHRSKDSGSPCP
jgi:hypothetical protein